MNLLSLKPRYGFAFLFFVVVLAGQTVQAQSVGNFNALWDALNATGDRDVSLSANLTGTMTDEDQAKIDFRLDDPIMAQIITITSGGRSIRYDSTPSGGEIYEFVIDIVTGGRLTFRDAANISGGYSDSGAFYVEDSTLEFGANANLHDNYSYSSGGAAYVIAMSGQGNIRVGGALTLKSNQAESDGGGFALFNPETFLTVTGAANLEANQSLGGGGGAIYGQGTVLTFSDTLTATENQAMGDGGALYLDTDAALDVTGIATFTKNAAGYDFEPESNNSGSGGAINANDSAATFKEEAIFGYKADADRTKNLGNTASLAGGAIYSTSSIFRFEKLATFGGNKATTGGGMDGGGAIYLSGGEFNFLQGATFQYNEAAQGDGGAIYNTGGQVISAGPVIFRNNTATGGMYGGGAIFGEVAAIFNFGGDVTFENNKAVAGAGSLGHGGAVFLTGIGSPSNDPVEYGWTSTAKATFSGNEAAGSGGAIYIESSALQFAEAHFVNNIARFAAADGSEAYAGGGGGAIFADMGNIVHFETKATLTNNSALNGSGGAIYTIGNGTVDPDDPLAGFHFKAGADLTGNKAGRGGAFYIEDSVIAFGGVTTLSRNEATGDGGAFYVQGISQLHFEAGSTTTIAENKAGGKGGAIYVAEDATLTMKLGGTDGTAATNVTIAAGTSNGGNDVFLDAGSTWEILADANSKLFINSALSGVTRAEGDTFLSVLGPGYVELNGNAAGFRGDVTVDGGTLKLGLGAGNLGDISGSAISVTGGGSIIVALNQDSTPGVNDFGRLQGTVLDMDGRILISMESFISDSEADTGGYALISLMDSNGESILLDYVENGLITGNNFDATKLQKEVRMQTDAGGNEIYTLYVWVYFDPNDPNMPWKFNVGSGTEVMDYYLDNTDAAYPGNAGKTLEVNGAGTLQLTRPQNFVSALLGNGNVQIDGKLTVNGQAVTTEQIFTGSLAGQGTFEKAGQYIQSITGSSENFEGNFDVKEGTLIGNSDSLRNTVAVAAGANLTIDQSTLSSISESPERTLNATLHGDGIVQIFGVTEIGTTGIRDSVLKIDSDQRTFTGNMNVDHGWLLVADQGDLSGIAGANKMTVLANGGLGGNGTVGNVQIQAGGAIQAYNGNLNVAGNLDISGGIVYVTLNDMQNADIIDVTGSVTIGDNSHFEIAGIADGYNEGERFVFLEAGSIQITGNVSSTTYVDGNGQTWTFNYELDDEGNLVAWGTHGGTPPPPPPPKPVVRGISWNRAEVAGSLAVLGPLASTPQPLKDFIVKLDTHKTTENDNTVYDDTYREATKQLAGSIRVDGLQLGLYSPYRTVFNRLGLGSELYSSAPIIYNNGYGAISGLENHGAGAGPTTYRGQDEYGNKILNPHFDNGMALCDVPMMMGENNFWADVTHVQSKIKSDGNSDEYGISRTGLLLGMDFQKQLNGRIGFLFGYFSPYLWQNNDRVEAEDYHAGLYFQKNHQGTDWHGYFGYAHQEYNSRRFVNMGIVDPAQFGLERYSGSTSGDSFNMSLEISRPRYYGSNVILRPLLGLDYYYTAQDGYRETGPAGGMFGLRYGKAEYDQLFVRVGATLKRETDFTSMVLRAQYINQFETDAYPGGQAQFLHGGSPTMNIRGVNLGRDYMNLGAGLNIFMNGARSRFLSFDYDFNMSKRMKSHGVSLILVERF